MTTEEKQLHLNNIMTGTSAIIDATTGLGYQEFAKQEQVKEEVYANLQMVGQAAHTLANGGDNLPGLNFPTDQLSAFRNARYNQEAEIDHQTVWHHAVQRANT